jgi:glycosyltransferase involved in cell wall biosynthesis
MRALFCHDNRYIYSQDNEVYSASQFPYKAWERYLKHFDELIVIGRGRWLRENEDTGSLNRSSGPKVAFVSLPDISSPTRMLTNRFEVAKRIAAEMPKVEALIVRGPSEFGMLAATIARRQGKPIAVEMSGCAWDHTWYHGTLVARMYAPIKFLRARALVRKADFVIYVSREFLQRRYHTFGRTEYASNVEISAPPPSVLETRLERIAADNSPMVFGLIGAVEHPLKGIGTALVALGRAKAALPAFKFRILGQGDPSRWSRLISQNGLDGYVEFCGTLPSGQPVLNWLDEVDVYLQPSFHEGVPRALIEAMSRGCPALGSTAGGVPELLDADCLHQRGGADQLSKQIVHAGQDKNWRRDQAQRNFAKAREYDQDHLIERRTQFWRDFADFAASAADRA